MNTEIKKVINQQIVRVSSEIGILKTEIAERAGKEADRAREKEASKQQRIKEENTRKFFSEIMGLIQDSIWGFDKQDTKDFYDKLLADGKVNYEFLQTLIDANDVTRLRGRIIEGAFELSGGSIRNIDDSGLVLDISQDQARANVALNRHIASEAKKNAKKYLKDLADSALDNQKEIISDFEMSIRRIRNSGEPLVKQMRAIMDLFLPLSYAGDFESGEAGERALKSSQDADKRALEQADRFKLNLGKRYKGQLKTLNETITSLIMARGRDILTVKKRFDNQLKDLGLDPTSVSESGLDVIASFGELMGIDDVAEAGKQYDAIVKRISTAETISGHRFNQYRVARQKKSENDLAAYRITKEETVLAHNRDGYEKLLMERAEARETEIKEEGQKNRESAEKVTADVKLHWEKFYDARDKREEKYREDTLKGAQSVVNTLNQVIPTEVGQSFGNMIGQFMGLRDNLIQTASLFGKTMTTATATPIAGMLLFVGQAYKMWKEGEDRIVEISKKTSEALESRKDALLQQAKEIGNAMGGEMSKGLVLDPETFIKQIAQSQIAEILGNAFSSALKTPINNIKAGIAGEIGDVGAAQQWIKDNENLFGDVINERARADLRAALTRRVRLNKDDPMAGMADFDLEFGFQHNEEDEMTRRMNPDEVMKAATALHPGLANHRTFVLNSLKAGLAGDDKSGLTDKELDDLIMRATAQEMVNNPGLEAGTKAFKNKAEEVSNRFRNVYSDLANMFGLGESSSATGQYGVPTATFSAVTEPQANNMLVMMTRQVNYLARIATNTDFLPQMALAQNMGGGVAAAPFIPINGNDDNAQKESSEIGVK